MAKKFYKVVHELPWMLVVMLDTEFAYRHKALGVKTTMDTIKEMVHFWVGDEDLLRENKGNYVNAFLQQLGNRCLMEVISDNWNIEGLLDWFAEAEGWVAMDGRYGIRLTYVSEQPLEESQYTIEEFTPKDPEAWTFDQPLPA